MFYLAKHTTEEEYNTVKDNLLKPQVALITETNRVDYIPPHMMLRLSILKVVRISILTREYILTHPKMLRYTLPQLYSIIVDLSY